MTKKQSVDSLILLRRERERQQAQPHPPYALELEMTRCIAQRDEPGALAVMREINRMQRATLSPDPLRSLRDSLICSCTLFTRAAITGGASMDMAFSLSDACIRVLEELDELQALADFEGEMIHEFIELTKDKNVGKLPDVVDAAVGYVGRHLMEPLTVAGVAAGVFVHPSYLSSSFRRVTGMTLTYYIQRERIRRAQEMLRRGRESIASIADACQFCSQSHFTQVFRRHTGETPEQFRRARGTVSLFEYGGRKMKLIRTGLEPDKLALRETLFHVANGYLGVRASPEEGVPAGVRSIRGAYLNAFYDTDDIVYGEKLYGFASRQQSIVNVADVQGVELLLDGERFDPFVGELSLYEQELDMEAGVYSRRVGWRSPAGRHTLLRFERMASFARRELLTLRVTVSPQDWDGPIEILSAQEGEVYNDYDPSDPRKLAQRKTMLRPVASRLDEGDLLMRCETAHSGLSMVSAVRHTVGAGFSAQLESGPTRNLARFIGTAGPERPVELVKWCVFTDSRRHAEPESDALRILREAVSRPLQAWYDMQSAFLAEFWRKSRAEVRGDDALNLSLCYSAYTLLQSAGRDSVSNIASKGLSGEGYEGHYFWDTEIYMFPFFLLTNREIARSLLDYRYSTLPGAFEQARLLGHERGALYPWRTIAGDECSAYFPSGSAQYHINGDIAHAFIDYYLVTGDLEYFAEKGARVLIETARLWLDAGHWRDGVFHIDDVTGPDEYTCLVNDNYYTNRSAQHHLRWTADICAALAAAGRMDGPRAQTGVTDEELQAFREAAEGMCLPYDEKLGIVAQDDSFLRKERLDLAAIPKENYPLLLHYHPLYLYRHQVCKQADAVLALLLYEDGLDEGVLERTYNYYEAITTHDSSLSPCVFAMMAARVGNIPKAYHYYSQTACLDLDDTHRNTCDGVHVANMGGAYMGVVFGFAGLRITGEGLTLRPRISGVWQGYRFRVHYRDTLLEIAVTGAEVSVRRLDGPAVRLRVYDTEALVEDAYVTATKNPRRKGDAQ